MNIEITIELLIEEIQASYSPFFVKNIDVKRESNEIFALISLSKITELNWIKFSFISL